MLKQFFSTLRRQVPAVPPPASATASGAKHGHTAPGADDAPVALLHSPLLPAPVSCWETVDSVLDIAHASALPPWGSLLAVTQRRGRGQMRRTWYSPPGNLYAALRLPLTEADHTRTLPVPPDIPSSGGACAEGPSVTAGAAASDAALSLAGLLAGTAAAPLVGALVVTALRELGLAVCLKWPNDIVLLDGRMPRKVGGILLEERCGQLWAGMGLNVAAAPTDTQMRAEHALPAGRLQEHFSAQLCSIMQDMAHVAPPAGLLWCWLVSRVYFCYTKKLPALSPWQPFVEAHLLWHGMPVCLTDTDGQHFGIITGIGPSGGLCLAEGGDVREFLSGSLAATEGDIP